MKHIFNIGDKKIHTYKVKKEDIAEFESGVVHEVCSTFTLGREMEWSSRLFVLEMKEDNEEGIGTFLEVKHASPALIGDELTLEATIDRLERNEIICDIVVKAGARLVATGKTGQKIIPRKKIDALFAQLRTNG